MFIVEAQNNNDDKYESHEFEDEELAIQVYKVLSKKYDSVVIMEIAAEI